MRIDSHHHFWKYDPVQYDWIGPEMGLLRRDFLPPDLEKELAASGIGGVVSVQARQKVEETAWLLDLAGENELIKGVVGWVPLVSPTVEADLERFAAHQKFKGVRHVLQGESDDRYMLREDFNAGIRAVGARGLVYDILIFERQLPQAIELVDRHPSQTFVLDHVAKPRIKENVFEPWNRNIRELARRPNVFCKLSGMVTEADWIGWSEDQLRPYVHAVLEAFGPRRLMFGSDWPVCLVASSYAGWMENGQGVGGQIIRARTSADFRCHGANGLQTRNAVRKRVSNPRRRRSFPGRDGSLSRPIYPGIRHPSLTVIQQKSGTARRAIPTWERPPAAGLLTRFPRATPKFSARRKYSIYGLAG